MLIQMFSGPNHYFAKNSEFTTLMYFKGPFSNTIVHVVLPSEGNKMLEPKKLNSWPVECGSEFLSSASNI